MGNLGEWMLESSLLILLILGIRKIFMGRIRYTAIYALWLVVFLRFLVPVNFIATPFSVENLVSEQVPSWSGKGQLEQQDTSSYSVVSVKKMETSLREQTEPEIQSAVQEGNTRLDEQSGAYRPVVSGGQKPKEEAASGWWDHLGIIWFAVSGILFLWFILSNMNLMRRMKTSRILYGRRDGLPIYLVSEIQNPCLYGLFRPAIYLPKTLVKGEEERQADKEEVGQMITHEYVHYRHGDHIWSMLRILLVSLYWFHPFLWLAVFLSKKDAELACDESVISRLGERKRFAYGEMLVRMAAEARWGEFRYSLMPMSRKGKEMEKRIRAIGNRRKYPKWLVIPLVMVVFLTVGLTCSSGVGPSAKVQNREEAVAENAKSMSGSLLFGMSRIVGAETCQEAFRQYIDVFTEAVNTGNLDKMSQVLEVNSEVYQKQCALVKNYHQRGIREKVMSCSITSMKKVTSKLVEMDSNENIKVTYATAPAKVISQNYRYTCEFINNTWIITKMEEIG